MNTITKATKISDNEMEVTTTSPASPDVTNQYTYEFLQAQLVSIQAQKDRDDAARDDELAEVNALIAQADQLGVAALPINAEPPITP